MQGVILHALYIIIGSFNLGRCLYQLFMVHSTTSENQPLLYIPFACNITCTYTLWYATHTHTHRSENGRVRHVCQASRLRSTNTALQTVPRGIPVEQKTKLTLTSPNPLSHTPHFTPQQYNCQAFVLHRLFACRSYSLFSSVVPFVHHAYYLNVYQL